MRARVLLACAILALPAQTAATADSLVRIDPARSQVSFTLGATLHTVEGTFAFPAGAIRLDPDGGVLEGRFVLDARTAATGNASRDRKMHREVLESERYPEIVLTIQAIDGAVGRQGDTDLTLHGTIEAHGAPHDVTIPIHVTFAGSELSGEARLVVPYVDWGMSDPSVFLLRVDKHVTVIVTFAGSLEPGLPASTRNGTTRRTANRRE